MPTVRRHLRHRKPDLLSASVGLRYNPGHLRLCQFEIKDLISKGTNFAVNGKVRHDAFPGIST